MRALRWLSLAALIALISLAGVFFLWFKALPDVRGEQIVPGQPPNELLGAGLRGVAHGPTAELEWANRERQHHGRW